MTWACRRRPSRAMWHMCGPIVDYAETDNSKC